MGLPTPDCTPQTPRGGPIAPMDLSGALPLPYRPPTAGPPPHPPMAEDLGGDGEVGGQWGAGKDTKRFYGAGKSEAKRS